jgi:hypothetical protein
MTRAFAALAIALLFGCRRGGPLEHDSGTSAPSVVPALAAVSESERARAEKTAIDYYAALSAKNCDALLALVANYNSKDCREDVDEWAEHGTSFVSADRVARDGRDPATLLVTCTVMIKDRGPRPMVLRVKREGDAWKVYKTA